MLIKQHHQKATLQSRLEKKLFNKLDTNIEIIATAEVILYKLIIILVVNVANVLDEILVHCFLFG